MWRTGEKQAALFVNSLLRARELAIIENAQWQRMIPNSDDLGLVHVEYAISE